MQRRNLHHGPKDMEHDLSGKNVLLCKDFWYFGDSAMKIPDYLLPVVKKGPGHKRLKDQTLVNKFILWKANDRNYFAKK